jgi:putative endonuclease
MSITIGNIKEDAALAFLKSQGLALIVRNFKGRFGEIDLIMREKDTTVFIEVRFRKSTQFGEGAETVTRAKQKRISKTASFFLSRYELFDASCRFDVVVINPDNSVNWIKHAFLAHN